MKRNRIITIIYYILAVVFYIVAIINIFDNTMRYGIIWLCLGSMWLCLGTVRFRKFKNKDDNSDNDDDSLKSPLDLLGYFSSSIYKFRTNGINVAGLRE